jgi:hypothetical protein
MKKLMVWVLFLLAFTTLAVAAQGIATVESIQFSEETTNVAKDVAVVRDGKATVVAENDSIEANDIIDTANKTISLKTQNGSVWKLDDKTKFSIHAATKEGKPVYMFLEGSAEYQAGEKAGETIVKINGKDYLVSAGAKVNFSRGVDVTSVTIIIGTVTFGKQVFNKTITIDAQGNVNLPPSHKTRGIRG